MVKAEDLLIHTWQEKEEGRNKFHKKKKKGFIRKENRVFMLLVQLLAAWKSIPITKGEARGEIWSFINYLFFIYTSLRKNEKVSHETGCTEWSASQKFG